MSARDQVTEVARLQHTVLATGHIAAFVEDEFTLDTPDGPVDLSRQYVSHPGAVAVIAVDDRDRIACVRQYRHPVGMTLVEPPAGLIDSPDEDPWLAAQRELAEEVELAADTWSVLVDVLLSPGGTSELIRIFLATDLRPTHRPEGFVLEGEEAAMDLVWLPVDEVVDAILAGQLSNPSLVSGVLALQDARTRGTALRPPTAPWPAREAQQSRLVELFGELGR